MGRRTAYHPARNCRCSSSTGTADLFAKCVYTVSCGCRDIRKCACVGPDLSHVATRYYIASGSMQNLPDHLRTWITHPQKIKPGVRMPQNNFTEEDLNALVTYIETLK